MTGSQKVNSKLVDLLVKSIDDSVDVELCKVKTVLNMPISTSCVASQREDLMFAGLIYMALTFPVLKMEKFLF